MQSSLQQGMMPRAEDNFLKYLYGQYCNYDENEASKGTADYSSQPLYLLLRAKPTQFLHPFRLATPLSNLSIICFVLDPLQIFLFSNSAEAQRGMQRLGTNW